MIELRRGICRTVWLVGPYAIKFPSLRRYNPGWLKGLMWSISRGIQANLAEASWSGTPGLCPVKWSFGGLVNVYPRAEPVPEDHPVDFDVIAPAWVPTDKKRDNLGLLDGELVWIDYDNSWNRCPHSEQVVR